jgi:hypothetical protein
MSQEEKPVVIEEKAWTGRQWLRFFIVVGSLFTIFCATLLSLEFNNPKIFTETAGGIVTVGMLSLVFGVWE